jgi:Leucine-rich repeat (LRR) protein
MKHNDNNRIDLSHNILSRLPWSMGYLVQIEILDVSHNNLIIPPRSAINMGTPAMLRWLRENEKKVCFFFFLKLFYVINLHHLLTSIDIIY